MASVRFVAIGDSFTEGVGDELPDGRVRGWADLVAQGWADAVGRADRVRQPRDPRPARLADRRRAARAGARAEAHAPVLQRRRQRHAAAQARASRASSTPSPASLERCDEEGVQLIILSGANPSGQLPLGRVFQRRGDLLTEAVTADHHGSARHHPRLQLAGPGAVHRRVLVGGPTPHECARTSSRRRARADGARHGAADRLVVAAHRCPRCRPAVRRTTASTSARGCAVA